MGSGNTKGGKPAEAGPKGAAAADGKQVKPGDATVDGPVAGMTRQTSPAPKPTKKADGEASASAVVGGSWTKPKGPSPLDDKVIEEWKASGKLIVLEDVMCTVPYKIMLVPKEGTEGDMKAKAQEIVNDVAKIALTVFSHFEADSEASKINAMPVGKVQELSKEMREVLTHVQTLNRLTRGIFDPAILPLYTHFKEKGTLAHDEAVEVAKYSKWSCFKLTDAGLEKLHEKAKLDVTGLAKGWAIDEISKRLKAAGCTSTYVDWGSDIKVTGTHPVGRNWTVAVVEPPSIEDIGKPLSDDAKNNYLAHIELRDGQAVCTSGDYRQKLHDTIEGPLSHIIDGAKGCPILITGDTVASITTVCDSCILSDALSTAAMACTSVKAARRLLDNFRGSGLKDPILDYLLYSRWGPRVLRLVEPGVEKPEHRDERLKRHEEAHVIVVGGGLAGVSAAIEARKGGAKVTLIDKESDLGGNSAKATSGINACNTRVQKAAGVEDDGRFFERDTHVSAKGGISDLACVTTLSDKSAEAIHWLIDEMGVPLHALSQLGGHSRKRTHRVPPRDDGKPVPVGWTIMQHARAAASSMEGIEVRTSCTVKKLITEKADESGIIEVLGIEYADESGQLVELRADATILTTGGFGYDHSEGSLMQQYRPDLVGVPTTNGSFANGDGIKFGKELGASLIDMDKVQLHPTAFIDPKDPGNHTKYLGPEALRGSGGLLLDQKGKRFVNELDLRSVVSSKILGHCDSYEMPDGSKYRPWAWCLLNEEAQEKFGKPMLHFYKDQVGLFQAAEGTKGVAEAIGCDEQNVIDTLREYQDACKQSICSKTGKVVFPSVVSETDTNFILARITPCIHYCMGGLEISSVGEVLTRQGHHAGAMGKRNKVRRLFAAGECTGGVHGGNRLGGNSLLECVVFGRLCGNRAATIKQKSATMLNSGEWLPLTLREVRSTDVKYGHNTAVYRFNLHGSMQTTGLEVGRFIGIRGELDGDTLTGYYSPISRPEDEGIIDILCRLDEKGGPIVELLMSLKPGSSCLMRGMGGCKLVRQPDNHFTYQGRQVNKLSLLCGGTGLAPAVQVARAYINAVAARGGTPLAPGGLRIVYAAETAGDLAFVAAFDGLKERYPDLIEYYLVLNKPPAGWTMGIGFVDPDVCRQRLWFPPADDHVLVMCGPPIFEKIMCGNLAKLGYPENQYYSFSADPEATA